MTLWHAIAVGSGALRASSGNAQYPTAEPGTTRTGLGANDADLNGPRKRMVANTVQHRRGSQLSLSQTVQEAYSIQHAHPTQRRLDTGQRLILSQTVPGNSPCPIAEPSIIRVNTGGILILPQTYQEICTLNPPFGQCVILFSCGPNY